MADSSLMEKIVAVAKRRGFIYQSSEVYGGINGFWDYGPLGAELKRNLRELWWRAMTRLREDVVGIDASIIMHPAIWKASGHVDTFSDLMRECSLTHKRVRADHVEPQRGVVLAYSGAECAAKGWKLERAFAVLMRQGEHIESFRKRVRALLAVQAGVAESEAESIVLHGEGKQGEVQASVDYHPETGGELTAARPFNLMLKTYVGPTATEEDVAYLRPETAQAIFAQFKNVLDSSRVKVPFGIAQIGKAFRNEVTPRNFTFRSREFEQMELEFFIRPDEAVELVCGSVAKWSEGVDLSQPQPNWGWELWHRYWVKERSEFYHTLGFTPDDYEHYWQAPQDLAHYSRACVDILFKFPFGTEELEGIAARGDFDLRQHQTHSGKSLEVFDEQVKVAAAALTPEQREAFTQRTIAAWEARGKSAQQAGEFLDRLYKGFYLPHVIEPSAGLDRLALAVLCHAFREEQATDEKGKTETRTVLALHPRVAPIKVGVFPLLKNKPELVAKARAVFELLRPHCNVFYDDSGSIGRRYARQDEAGTPVCITVDFETLEGVKEGELAGVVDTVTVRCRDTGSQKRMAIDQLLPTLLPMLV